MIHLSYGNLRRKTKLSLVLLYDSVYVILPKRSASKLTFNFLILMPIGIIFVFGKVTKFQNKFANSVVMAFDVENLKIS